MEIDMDNCYAWCIVPFDNQDRNPIARIDMLKELGFKAYAYDWRERHLPEMISYISLEAEDLGCRVGLYNHGDWFGRPENLVKIIELMPKLEIGIVFNFHHAHDMINEFPELAKMMKPYLWAVNLNGMNPEGPKILPIGQGEKEKEMLATLEDNGYHGPYGILGHVEDADVKEILKKNLAGLKSLSTRD
jgi:hypothetical protein